MLALAAVFKHLPYLATLADWIGPWVDVTRIKDLPMWALQGSQDKEIQIKLGNGTFEWMKQHGHNLKFTEMANRGDDVVQAALRYTGDSLVAQAM